MISGQPRSAPKTTAPLDADALLVVGPPQKYDDPSLWAIDQAIIARHPAAFLVDTKRFLIQQFMVMHNPPAWRICLKTTASRFPTSWSMTPNVKPWE